MKNLLTNLRIEIYISVGLIMISLILYNRLIRIRLPKNLEFYINESLNYVIVYITISWIIISLLIIFVSIKLIFLLPSKENFITRSLSVFSVFISESFISVALIPETYFNYDIYDNISRFASYFNKTLGKKRKDLLLLISFSIRVIVLLSFLYDVFFNFKLEIFYKMLPLLLIPIIIKVIIFFLREYSNNYDELIEYFDIERMDNGFVFTLSQSAQKESLDMDYTLNELQNCVQIKYYLDQYDIIVNHYQPRVYLFIYSFYFIGWLYVILINYSLYF